ncbi:TFIIB-type zinc finger domain-containing protein [Vagococcus fluvialis]|uniref:TFIIB-type zinc finger domain-containing protein n=1 Tax=Vagococcus fluvialis TaxID=2738 RepID=UPI003B59EFBC
MEKVICEVCGSKDFTKEEDFFVCDYCGVKYTIFQFKDMVKGIVKGNIETQSLKIENLNKLLFTAISNDDFDDIKKYSVMILEIDADDITAQFYKLVGNIGTSRIKDINIQETSTDLITFYMMLDEDTEEYINKIIHLYSLSGIMTSYIYSYIKHYFVYGNLSDDLDQTLSIDYNFGSADFVYDYCKIKDVLTENTLELFKENIVELHKLNIEWMINNELHKTINKYIIPKNTYRSLEQVKEDLLLFSWQLSRLQNYINHISVTSSKLDACIKLESVLSEISNKNVYFSSNSGTTTSVSSKDNEILQNTLQFCRSEISRISLELKKTEDKKSEKKLKEIYPDYIETLEQKKVELEEKLSSISFFNFKEKEKLKSDIKLIKNFIQYPATNATSIYNFINES